MKRSFVNTGFYKFAFALLIFLLAPWRSGLALLQVNRVVLVDDFDRHEKTNRLGGESEGDVKPPGTCRVRYATAVEAFGQGGASLALDYDVSEPDTLASFRLRLAKKGASREAVVPADLTAMKYISFWMNHKPGIAQARPGEVGLELYEDTDGDGRFTAGKDTLEQMPLSSSLNRKEKEGWQKVLIPLARFRKIRRWDRVVEMRLIFDHRARLGKGTLLIDNLLFGSNYPEAFTGKEISMQNRASSFKINSQLVQSGMRVKKKSFSMTLTLTFIDPYLEEVRFEEKKGEAGAWKGVGSFFDHSQGGIYETAVKKKSLPDRPSRKGLWFRAVGVSLFGGEAELVGPYRIQID